MLPYDYVMSFIISLCPYVWKKVMDPRVEAIALRKKHIDPKLDKEAKRSVFIYYIFVIIIVTSMVVYSL